MGVFSAFSVALSALQAESGAIDTTGNNLANLNTTGFKGSSVDFRDMVSQAIGVGASATSVGLGVTTPLNIQQFTQGSLQTSASPLDCAIQGNGFFIVRNASGDQLYTRDGSFTVNADGTLITQSGEFVQGWTATPTGLNTSGAISNITVPAGTVLPPSATQNVTLDLNLNALAATDATSTFSQPVQIYDSLGGAHTLTFTFTKTAANAWSATVTIPGADVGSTSGPTTIGTADFTFDPNTGLLLSPAAGAPVALTITGLADGATFPAAINWNLYDTSGAGSLTQYAQPSSLASSTQDGRAAAQMTSVAITDGGQVLATFSDGQTRVEGQLAVANIRNPNTLKNVGLNDFAATGATAAPAIGTPETGGRGSILGSTLEASNVDMATQFTNLIIYQRGYQAATKVISTADSMTQDLVNLIR
ncbi:MAG TPA: flagellar hook protein FlgE [Bryobacteraceae bacterium]|nr:flagellar hook protein FlgE [Bryobacteraceae bacterium]